MLLTFRCSSQLPSIEHTFSLPFAHNLSTSLSRSLR